MKAKIKLQKKKEWRSPELIVLLRNKPEDVVFGFTSCKGTAKTETIMMNSGCLTYGPCAACFTIANT
jgi:hypothetical protein